MRIFRDKKAVTAIEYALIVALFALVALTAFFYFSDQTGAMYSKIKDAVVSANNGE